MTEVEAREILDRVVEIHEAAIALKIQSEDTERYLTFNMPISNYETSEIHVGRSVFNHIVHTLNIETFVEKFDKLPLIQVCFEYKGYKILKVVTISKEGVECLI